MGRRGRMSERNQRNRCSVGWMIVVEVDEENTGSTLSSTYILWSFFFSVIGYEHYPLYMRGT